MKRTLGGFCLAAALALSLTAVAHTQQKAPDTAPMTDVQAAGVTRVKEMIEALNTGDYATIRAYFEAQSDPNGFVNALGQYRLSRGFDLLRVELVPNRGDLVAGIVRNRITGDESYLAVRIEPQAPHRIILFQARVPDEAAARWKLKPATSAAVTEEERLREIGAYLKRMGDADLFWGTVVIARDGKPVFAQAYGYADRAKKIPNTLDTPFMLASMNKIFTGLAIGQLVEQGKLSYDDPLSKFLPDFPDPESAKKIAIKHLLTHTSGLAREGSPIEGSSIERPTTVKAMVETFERKPLAFEPGTKHAYSNMGFVLLGRVIETVTGQDYYDYIQKHVFAPAGATTASFPLFPKDGVAVVPMAYPYESALSSDNRLSFESQLGKYGRRGSPAGDSVASALDILRLSTAMRAGRIVKPETFRLHSSGKPELNSPIYGYGIIAGPYLGRPFVGHNGRSFGHCTEFGELRDTPYTLVVLSNLGMYECRQVTQRILRELRPAASPAAKLQARPERLDTTRPRFDDPDAAARSDLARRQPTDGRLDMPRLYEAATRRVASLTRFSTAIDRGLPAAQAASRLWLSGSRVTSLSGNSATGVLDAWTPLGPGNIGGRTRVVKFHPTDPTTLFAAGVSGGVWRSDDSGATWRPTGDGLTNIAVNSLLIDPANPDVMYAGTGEGYLREEIRGTGLPLRGSGIYVTTDGAKSWQQLPATNTPDFHWVNDLEFGGNDSRRIYAATRSGVWRSTDGGVTWARMLAADVRGGCLDLALRILRSEDVLFASCGSYEQATVYRFIGAASRSDAEVVLREPDMGRTSLAIAPSNPNIIYALAASNAPGPNGIYQQGLLAVYRSAANGTRGSWERRVDNRDRRFLNTMLLTNTATAAARVCTPQGSNALPATMGWYNNVIAVDPRDPNRVWAAGVDWFRSDDGGANWGLASWANANLPSYSHVDQHAITFHPHYDGESNQVVLIGNDGGIFRSTNARAATSNGPQAACTGGQPIQVAWKSLNRGYGVTQFYHGTPFPDGTQYLGGTQDNGTLLGSDAAGPEGWKLVFGGDGGYSAVHPTQTGTWLMESQWSNVVRTTNSGATISGSRAGLDPIMASGLGPQGNFLFIPPFTHDPVADVVWLGGEFLYRGGNFGQSWSKVLSSQAPDGGRVSAIAISPRANAIVFAGTDRGHILRTTNATDPVAAIAFSTTQPRQGWVTSIAVDAASGAVYATYGNFGGAHVFRSIDNGETWQSLDGSGPDGLPDIPVHSIVVDPDDRNRLYLGTDLGVMVSVDGGGTWMTEETGFGPAVTMWLSLIRTPAGQKQLFAFTHGRGAWRVTLR